MPTPFETLAPTMDSKVDSWLGDTLRVQRAGAPGFVEMVGWVIDSDPLTGAILDGIRDKKRIKVAKALWPTISKFDRVQADKLGDGTFMPAGKGNTTGMRYWIFDIQEA